MNYRRFARVVRHIHNFWIVVLLANIFLSAFVPSMRLVSLVVIVATGFSQVLWGGCPLTVLERSLLVKAGDEPYEGSYLVDFFRRRFGIEIPPWVITAQMVAITVLATYLAMQGHLDQHLNRLLD